MYSTFSALFPSSVRLRYTYLPRVEQTRMQGTNQHALAALEKMIIHQIQKASFLGTVPYLTFPSLLSFVPKT